MIFISTEVEITEESRIRVFTVWNNISQIINVNIYHGIYMR